MPSYVCGFAFYDYVDDYGWPHKIIVLINKQHPPEQKNKLNGVGGKIEDGETNRQAMRREFLEEAGQHVQDWQRLVEWDQQVEPEQQTP